MERNNYVFRITDMDEEYLPQIGDGLEKRTELMSRNQCPGMWKTTDRLRASVREPGKARNIFRRILSPLLCLPALHMHMLHRRLSRGMARKEDLQKLVIS